jgi:hypothetical protein
MAGDATVATNPDAVTERVNARLDKAMKSASLQVFIIPKRVSD